MAYTSVSKTDERKLVRVQLPPSALNCTVDPKDAAPVGSREILRGNAKNK